MQNISEPLNQYSLLSTKKVDELESFVATKDLLINISRNKSDDRTSKSIINALRLPNTCISYLRFPASVELIARSYFPHFNLSLPARGSFSVCVDNKQIIGDKETGALGSPQCDQRIILDQNSSRFCISFSQNAVISMLETMLGKPISAPLLFSPKVELRSNEDRSLSSLIYVLINDVVNENHSLDHPLVCAQFEQLLISILLTTQPHNYSKAIEAPTPVTASRDVKRALDYIHAHLSEPILLSKLVEVSGVPGRSLFAHFRQFTGQSPLAYVTECRLARAREDLINNKSQDTVTTIAMRWGFTQLGRFSGLYRKTYGELPRETLKH